MKKLLLSFTILVLIFATLESNQALTQRAGAIITRVKHLFVKQPAATPKTPTIKVGYVTIKGDIKGYDQHFLALKTLGDDKEIDCILIDIDSPGGSGATAEILSDLIQNIKTTKLVISFVADQACSAAYMIISNSSHIITPLNAYVGSIGAISALSLDKKTQTTYITSGKYKAPSYNAEGELDGEYKSYKQETINEGAENAFALVSTGRNIPIETIKDFQAKVFTAKQALKLGLVDEIGTFNAMVKKITTAIEDKNKSTYDKVTFINSDNKVIATFNTIR
jgi:signal peptide peptidase SppA